MMQGGSISELALRITRGVYKAIPDRFSKVMNRTVAIMLQTGACALFYGDDGYSFLTFIHPSSETSHRPSMAQLLRAMVGCFHAVRLAVFFQ